MRTRRHTQPTSIAAVGIKAQAVVGHPPCQCGTSGHASITDRARDALMHTLLRINPQLHGQYILTQEKLASLVNLVNKGIY
jgi:hypothetical protein